MRNEKFDSEYNEIKELILETKKVAEETRGYAKSVKNYIRMMQIAGMIRLVLIAIPIVLAVIYLPQFLSKFTEIYKAIFSSGGPQLEIIEKFLGKNATGIIQGFQKK